MLYAKMAAILSRGRWVQMTPGSASNSLTTIFSLQWDSLNVLYTASCPWILDPLSWTAIHSHDPWSSLMIRDPLSCFMVHSHDPWSSLTIPDQLFMISDPLSLGHLFRMHQRFIDHHLLRHVTISSHLQLSLLLYWQLRWVLATKQEGVCRKISCHITYIYEQDLLTLYMTLHLTSL